MIAEGREIIYFDECALNFYKMINSFKPLCWQPKDVTFLYPYGEAAETGSVHIIAAVGPAIQGSIVWKYIESTNTDDVLNFLKLVKSRLVDEKIRPISVCDNAPAHFSVECLRWAELEGFQIEHTAAYS